jgi:hypothetical protein
MTQWLYVDGFARLPLRGQLRNDHAGLQDFTGFPFQPSTHADSHLRPGHGSACPYLRLARDLQARLYVTYTRRQRILSNKGSCR